MKFLIAGCGYLGSRVARLWTRQGFEVAAVTRNPDKANQLREQGISPLVGDICSPESLPILPANIETLLVAVGFDRSPHQQIQEVYRNGLANLIGSLPTIPQRVIYISSTGVYGGQTSGAREAQSVNEQSACQPTRAGSQASLEAERWLHDSSVGDKTLVLRLAGIYGPDRIPNLVNIRQAEPIASNPDALLNLIHVDDAAAVVDFMAQHVHPPDVFNVSDGHPVPRREFYQAIAERVGASPPQFATATTLTDPRRRGGENKIVDSSKLHQLLRQHGMTLRYPHFRDGLNSALPNP